MEPILHPLLNGWRADLAAKTDAPAYRVLCRSIRLGFAAHPPDVLAAGVEQLCGVIWP